MKLRAETRRLTFMSLFLATALAAGIHAPVLRAQDDMLDEADDALQMDDINIDGKLSASERLRQRREKLEERNKVMVEKKIEDIRVKQEIALTNKLQDAFGKSLNNLNEDKVQVTQAAPIAPQPVIAPPAVVETKIIEEKIEPVKVEKKSKVIPYLGATAIKGDRVDFESKLNLGVNVETFVMSQLSVGLGIGYTSLDITDTANNYILSNNGIYYNNTNYYNTFGQNGRKMNFDKLNVEANSKFFLTVESKIKPFIGLGLNYNRSNLKYEDAGNGYSFNNTYGTNVATAGNEGFSSSTLGASAKLGTEIDFNDTIGFNIDLSYSKNLSSGISSNANTTLTNPDQVRLQNVTKFMEDSDITAVQAGLVVKF